MFVCVFNLSVTLLVIVEALTVTIERNKNALSNQRVKGMDVFLFLFCFVFTPTVFSLQLLLPRHNNVKGNYAMCNLAVLCCQSRLRANE